MIRETRNSGIRDMLIAADDEFRARWRQPRPGWGFLSDEQRELPMLEWGTDLRAGKPVVVSSSQLLCALSHARLPHRDFAFGGKHYSSAFLLDELDNLTELVPE